MNALEADQNGISRRIQVSRNQWFAIEKRVLEQRSQIRSGQRDQKSGLGDKLTQIKIRLTQDVGSCVEK